MNYYYFVYIVEVVLCVLFGGAVFKKKKKTFIILSFLTISFFTMFRYTPQYADYTNYSRYYLKAAEFSAQELSTTRTPLLYLIMVFENFFVSDPQAYFILTGFFINYSFLRWFYKYSTNECISVVAFVGLGFWGSSINIIRQYFSIALILFVYDRLIKRKKKISDYIVILFVLVLAYLNHPSSIVSFSLIFIYLIPFPKNGIKGTIVFFIILFGASFGISFGLTHLYGNYLNDGVYGTESANAFGLVVPFFIFIVSWINRNKMLEENDDAKFLILCSLVGVVFTIQSVRGMLIVARIATYFTIFNLILLPSAIKQLLWRFGERDRLILSIIGISLIFSAYYLTGRGGEITQLHFLW